MVHFQKGIDSEKCTYINGVIWGHNHIALMQNGLDDWIHLKDRLIRHPFSKQLISYSQTMLTSEEGGGYPNVNVTRKLLL